MRGGLRQSKNLLKLAVLGFFGVLALLLASFVAQTFVGVTRSEETNEIFNDAAELPPGLVDAVLWEPDSEDLIRPMEPLTRVDITSAWIRAWEQLSIVAATEEGLDTSGLEIYFSSSAQESLLAAVAATPQSPVHQLSHRLRLTFYSRDGKVVGLEANEVELLRSTPFTRPNVDGELEQRFGWAQVTESYDVVLLLEDGNWRIQHWARDTQESQWWSDPAEPASDLAQLGRVGNGINYYPRVTPFAEFWPNFDVDVVDEDFARIAELGFDSVRIFLPFHELGGVDVVEENLEPVTELLDVARDHDLAVVVTLFDGWTDHRTEQWNRDRRHLEVVVPALAGHPALAMWDLKNEPDRDFDRFGVDQDLSHAWISFIARAVRELDPATPTTVGWATAQAALTAPPVTDVVSFHHYTEADELYRLGPALVERSGGRPVWLTEYGLPTWNSIFPGGHTEAEQRVYVAEVLAAADEVGIEASMIWTLWDLAAAPPDAGAMPWRTGPQVNLGILRPDGTAKPVVDVLSGAVAPDQVEPLGPANRLGKRFWQLAVLAALGWVGLVVVRRVVWPRLQPRLVGSRPWMALVAVRRRRRLRRQIRVRRRPDLPSLPRPSLGRPSRRPARRRPARRGLHWFTGWRGRLMRRRFRRRRGSGKRGRFRNRRR